MSAALLAGCAMTAPPQRTPDATNPADPMSAPTLPGKATGTLFGASVWEDPGESYAAALERQNDQFGPLQIVRVYLPDTDPLMPWTSQELSTDLPMQVSFKGDPAAVVSGTQDSNYLAWFEAAPRGRTTYWTFFHEPEDNISSGQFTAAQYVAAWRHLKELANKVGNPRLVATLSLMNWSLMPESGRNWKDMYPGGDVIDVLAWDVNNLGSPSGVYEDPAELLDPVIDASRSVGKPWAVAEWGSALLGDDQGEGRAAWMMQMGNYMGAEGALYATYFYSTVGGEGRLLDQPSMAAQRALCTWG